jgi:hypothetical protein
MSSQSQSYFIANKFESFDTLILLDDVDDDDDHDSDPFVNYLAQAALIRFLYLYLRSEHAISDRVMVKRRSARILFQGSHLWWYGGMPTMPLNALMANVSPVSRADTICSLLCDDNLMRRSARSLATILLAYQLQIHSDNLALTLKTNSEPTKYRRVLAAVVHPGSSAKSWIQNGSKFGLEYILRLFFRSPTLTARTIKSAIINDDFPPAAYIDPLTKYHDLLGFTKARQEFIDKSSIATHLEIYPEMLKFVEYAKKFNSTFREYSIDEGWFNQMIINGTNFAETLWLETDLYFELWSKRLQDDEMKQCEALGTCSVPSS